MCGSFFAFVGLSATRSPDKVLSVCMSSLPVIIVNYMYLYATYSNYMHR